MRNEPAGLLKRLLGKKLYLLAALCLGVLLLLLPWGEKTSAEPPPSAPGFRLEEEEKRLAQALSKIEGAGQVTVMLTLETSTQQEYARNLEGSRESQADGSAASQDMSQIAEVSNAALTVKYLYPRYRGALVVVQGGGSAVKLAVTQAVAALTGLSTDRITVVKGG